MAARTLGQTPAHDADLGPRVVYTTLADGTVVREKLTWSPYEKWVTKEGHVQRVKMTTSASIRNQPEYRDKIQKYKRAAGAIRYSSCPLREGTLAAEAFPAELAEHMCEAGSYSEKKCCPHVGHIIKRRREAQIAAAKKLAEMRQSAEDRKIKLMEEQNQLLREQGRGKAKSAPKA